MCRHVARQAAVAHEVGDLVRGLRRVGPEVPLHRAVAQAGVGEPLLAADEVRELHRVADEEDRGVVADEVPVAVRRCRSGSTKPRTSRQVSGEPSSPATVEKRARVRRRRALPEDRGLRVAARCRACTSKVPKAPDPLACGLRSGMFSRLKCARVSSRWTSCRRSGPFGGEAQAVLVALAPRRRWPWSTRWGCRGPRGVRTGRSSSLLLRSGPCGPATLAPCLERVKRTGL